MTLDHHEFMHGDIKLENVFVHQIRMENLNFISPILGMPKIPTKEM